MPVTGRALSLAPATTLSGCSTPLRLDDRDPWSWRSVPSATFDTLAGAWHAKPIAADIGTSSFLGLVSDL